jgi:arylmalonate decarboxylase
MRQRTIGMIVPPASGEVPPEAYALFPSGIDFIARGVAIGSVSIGSFDAVVDRIVPLAVELKDEGAEAVSMMGTSLSFFRGVAFNDRLTEAMREATGLPVTTMSNGIRDALRAVGARRVAVGTAYTEEINEKCRAYLTGCGFEVLSLESLGLAAVGDIHAVTEAEVVALGERAAAKAGGRMDAVLISCGGLRATNLAPALEPRVGVPVVASATAGVWASVRLLGIDTGVYGLGALGKAA